MFLARGFKDRIRQLGIRVFPKKSCVLYVPSTRVKRCFVLYVPSTRVKRGCVLYVPSTRVKRSCVLYVPSTRVHESIPVRLAWLSKKEIFNGSVLVCPVLLPKESLRENIQVCPAGFSKLI